MRDELKALLVALDELKDVGDLLTGVVDKRDIEAENVLRMWHHAKDNLSRRVEALKSAV